MSDKPLVLDVPEDLLAQAQIAHIDLRQIIIQAIEMEVARLRGNIFPAPKRIVPSREVIEAEIQAARRRLDAGETRTRILGLHAGSSWIADDFDDLLPDEFWGDLFQ